MTRRFAVDPAGSGGALVSRRAVVSRRALLAGGALATGGALAAALAGCTPAPPRTWNIGGGAVGGYFGEFTQLLADTARATGSPDQLRILDSTGSMVNVQGLVTGRFDFGLALTDSLGQSASALSAVARVYQTYWQLLVPTGSRVTAASDLRGLRISLGPNGSGTQFTAHRLLAAAGLAPTEYTEVAVTVAESARLVQSGELDALLVAGGVPLPAVERQLGDSVRLIGLERETAALIEQYGEGYFRVEIPAGVYGSTSPTVSLGVSSLLLCSPRVPDESVANVVRLLVTYPGRLVPESTVGTQYLDPRSMIYTGSVRLHPGAQRVYRELHG